MSELVVIIVSLVRGMCLGTVVCLIGDSLNMPPWKMIMLIVAVCILDVVTR